jgi:inhibitor of cysteine peptidase
VKKINPAFAIQTSVTLLFVLGLALVPKAQPVSGPARPSESELPVVGSFQQLKKLMAEGQGGRAAASGRVELDFPGTAESLSASPSMKLSGDTAYSGTNVQVRGVDEADIVKTDGKYIYQVADGRVIVTRLDPAKGMAIAAELKYDGPTEEGQQFVPSDLYVDAKHLVLIGSAYSELPAGEPQSGQGSSAGPSAVRSMISELIEPDSPDFPSTRPTEIRTTVKALIYDIGDKSDPKKVREVELEGGYVSSRKIGAALYLVASQWVDEYRIMQEEKDTAAVRPGYRDTAAGGEFDRISYADISYFPGSSEPSYLLIGALSLERPDEEMQVSTYLGAGQSVYSSRKNLYVAVAKAEAVSGGASPASTSKIGVLPSPEVMPVFNTATVVHKFGLGDGRVEYGGSGEIPGMLLNQFSMDEHNGYFRVATTVGDAWRTDEGISKNNLYVLDADLKTVGRVEGMAPGETIYSVRFMGERGYIVTFKTVDPLFVLDLKDPRQPRIAGELKIPGYSDYLHPLDEDHIIGFGKDAVEQASIGDGQATAVDLGLKIAVFDVSEPSRPVEKFNTVIGDRGTESELLQNHKALFFDAQKGLLAFPVSVAKAASPPEDDGLRFMPDFGEIAFQGAYIYRIKKDRTLDLTGRITHRGRSTGTDAGGNRFVQRILSVADRLYTVSSGMIKASDIDTLEEQESITLD